MNGNYRHFHAFILAFVATTLVGAADAHGDVVTDANARAADIALRLPSTAMAVRAMAIVQVSVFEAVNAITGRYPATGARIEAPADASVDAAVAAATRMALSKLVPSQQAAIDADYQAALAVVPDGRAKDAGIRVGEQAAAAILAQRLDDGAAAAESYRPRTAAGVYVPTTAPAVPHWGNRRPWVMARGDQLRPAPPPSLTSDTGTRDYNEIRALGAKDSKRRTPEQTAVARFWETTAPSVYWPVARSVANAPGRRIDG
jgi:hypothetical protein